MLQFTVHHLTETELASAWPLVRATRSPPDLERWLLLARALMSRGGGVLAVSAEDGLIHGIATYEPVHKPEVGQVLEVRTLATFELSRRARVRRILCQALDQLARSTGCVAVAVGHGNRGYIAELRRRASAANENAQGRETVVVLKAPATAISAGSAETNADRS